MKRLFVLVFLLVAARADAEVCQRYSRKYATATTIDFCLKTYNSGASNDNEKLQLKVDATFAAGDIKIAKDEGAEANIGTLPTDEGSCYSMPLTGTELTAARVYIATIDQTSPKIWIDWCGIIETYGNASAQNATPDVNVVSLADDSITAASIAASAIGASEIAADAIGASEIASDAIGAAEVADGAIDAATLAADTITAAKIATDAIGASEIATDAIGAAEIAADAIGASEIATDAIGAAEVAANTINDSELADTLTVAITGNITGNLSGSIGSLGTTAKADVNGEVLDVLGTDTFAELSALPGASPTILQMLQWVYQVSAFKLEQTSSSLVIRKRDGTTLLGTSTTADNGTTTTRGIFQ